MFALWLIWMKEKQQCKFILSENFLFFRLNLDLSNISLPVIHVFVTTIFIQVLCALRKCELGNFLQSFSQKQIQIRLVSKLQLAFKLSGWINNYSFLFQAVVICYTLLVVPMMQQNQLLFKVCYTIINLRK